MHPDALGRAREIRIRHDQSDEPRSAFGIAAERYELGPREGEAHIDMLGKENGAPARVAGAVESGVRRHEADDHRWVTWQLLGDMLEEGRRRERIPRRVEDLGGDLSDQRDGPEPSEE